MIFVKEIEQILEVYFTSDKMEANTLTEVFTSAKASHLDLDQLYSSLKLSLESNCDFAKVLHVQNLYNKFNPNNNDENGLKLFHEKMCHKKQEKGATSYTWSGPQLEAMWNLDLTSEEVKKYKIDFKTIMNFFAVAGPIAKNGWYNADKKFSQWTLIYIIKVSYINFKFDPLIIELLGNAINYGYSMEYFDSFIKITSINEESKTINSWKCRKEILNGFFSPSRLKDKQFDSDRVNYAKIDIKFANEHLKGLLELKKPKKTCTDFVAEINPILEVYFKSHTMQAAHLTELLTIAKTVKKDLDQLHTCFKFSDIVESEVVKNKLITRSNDLTDEKFTIFQEKVFEMFRKLVIKDQKIADLCKNTNPDYNGQNKKNILKLFRHLFNYEKDIETLNPLFKIEKK